jgi:hypothetical protein
VVTALTLTARTRKSTTRITTFPDFRVLCFVSALALANRSARFLDKLAACPASQWPPRSL